MKKALLIFLSVISIGSFGQNYSQMGAIGHYNYFLVLDIGTFVTLETVKDTVINGMDSQKLKETKYNLSKVPIDSSYYYISATDSSVYHFDSENNFSMGKLYDYTLEAGDSLNLANYSVTLYIDSVSTRTINGKSRIVQHISQRSVANFLEGETIQGIGNVYYFFPTADNDPRHGLRCYDDAYMGSYHHPGSDSCTAIITSLEEHAASENLIEFYPNPAKDKIWLKKFRNASANSVRYKIFNAEGRLVRAHEDFMLDEAIDIKNFRPGVYFIFLLIDGKERLGKFVKR